MDQLIIYIVFPQPLAKPTSPSARQRGVLEHYVVPVTLPYQPILNVVVVSRRKALDNVYSTPPANVLREFPESVFDVDFRVLNGDGYEERKLFVPAQRH